MTMVRLCLSIIKALDGLEQVKAMIRDKYTDKDRAISVEDSLIYYRKLIWLFRLL